MNLSDDQKSAVARWLEAGASLADVQKRLREDFQVTLTYLDTRFLVDDLKLAPRDPEPPAPEPPAPEPPAPEPVAAPVATLADEAFADDDLPPPPLPAGGGKVNVSIDQIMQPGTMISGKVTFSDGEIADWYLDQAGRLGLNPTTIGYRPVERDVLAFQVELQRIARTQGY